MQITIEVLPTYPTFWETFFSWLAKEKECITVREYTKYLYKTAGKNKGYAIRKYADNPYIINTMLERFYDFMLQCKNTVMLECAQKCIDNIVGD